MVRELNLGLFAAIVCVVAALACAVPLAAKPAAPAVQLPQVNATATRQQQDLEHPITDDGTVRSERSTNLSHITGSARKIRMYVKNRHLQVLPDGTVNGTSDDTSDYSKCDHLYLLESDVILLHVFLFHVIFLWHFFI